MTSAREQIIKSLEDKEFRDLFVVERVGQRAALQIRAMRKQRGWTQHELAQRIGTVQEVISKLEDPDYGKFTISTLLRLQSAFDCGLAVEFFPISTIVDWSLGNTYADIAVPAYADDARLWRSAAVSLNMAIDALPTSGSKTGLAFGSVAATDGVPNITPIYTQRDTKMVAVAGEQGAYA